MASIVTPGFAGSHDQRDYMMTRKSTSLVFLAFVFSLTGWQTLASSSQFDPSIDAFWMKFKAAVINADKAGVAQMTAFPVTMPYGVPPIRTRAQLLARY